MKLPSSHTYIIFTFQNYNAYFEKIVLISSFVFKGSTKDEGSDVLHLNNDGVNEVLFKVKLLEETLRIEPSRGIIEPKSSIEVKSKYQTQTIVLCPV